MLNAVSSKSVRSQTYLYAGLEMVITALMSLFGMSYLHSHPEILASFRMASLVLFIIQIVLIFLMNSAIRSQQLRPLWAASITFAGLEGLILAPVMLWTNPMIIMEALLATVVLFALLTAVSLLTPIDTSKWRNILWISTIALIVVSLIRLLIGSSTFHIIISVITLVIFSAWLMHDTQQLSEMESQSDNATVIALSMALTIYLDVLNIFMSLLNILGLSSSSD